MAGGSAPGTAVSGGVLEAALSLMPLHLLVDGAGVIQSAGATLHRIIGARQNRFDEAFDPIGGQPLDALAGLERVFLRLRDDPGQVLRGRAVRLASGGTLFNLGFGSGVVQAIPRFDLTDRDFAPSELAMEVLFLNEANRAMTDELSRANLRLEEARTKAEAEAFTDPLTGLFNRRGLELAFAALRAGTAADPPDHFAVIVLDLDRFKQLNDTRGHAAGDEMLRAVSTRLRAITREADTVARLGGDEFVLLVPHCTEAAKAMPLCRRIIDAIEQPLIIDGFLCQVSTCLGLALSSDFPFLSWPRIESAADRALYAAKAAGPGSIRLASTMAGS